MAVDYFLKLDGIDGESADSKNKGQIDLQSFSWGEAQTGTHGAGGGGGAGKVQMQDFHFVMKNNKASPKLMLACANGEHIKKGVLTCRKAGKDQQLGWQRQAAPTFGHVGHRKTVAGGSIIEKEQGDQHEDRAAQRIQKEIERRPLPVRPAQAVDQEE